MLVGRIYCSCNTTYVSKGDTFSKTSENWTGFHSSLKKEKENIEMEQEHINTQISNL